MDLFEELAQLVKLIEKQRYLLVGGLAYSLYVKPRFTQDIDIAIREDDFEAIQALLLKNGFLPTENIMRFKNVKIGRCLKPVGDDMLMIDFVLESKLKFENMYKRREEIRDPESGLTLTVASPEDLIKLKQRRRSNQDKLDIKELEGLDLDHE